MLNGGKLGGTWTHVSSPALLLAKRVNRSSFSFDSIRKEKQSSYMSPFVNANESLLGSMNDQLPNYLGECTWATYYPHLPPSLPPCGVFFKTLKNLIFYRLLKSGR